MLQKLDEIISLLREIKQLLGCNIDTGKPFAGDPNKYYGSTYVGDDPSQFSHYGVGTITTSGTKDTTTATKGGGAGYEGYYTTQDKPKQTKKDKLETVVIMTTCPELVEQILIGNRDMFYGETLEIIIDKKLSERLYNIK